MSMNVILASMVLLGVLHQQCLSANCPAERETSMRLVVVSKRNLTGHWTAEAQLEHGMAITTNDEVNTMPWTLKLEQSTAQCSKLESVILTATVVAPPPKAGPGYEFYKGLGYYKLHRTPKTWSEARDTCIQEGAHLAIINSEEESNILKDMFEKLVPEKNFAWAFIGFHDLYTENQFLTVFGEPLSSTGFVNWSSEHEPNNLGGSDTHPGEDCGTIHRNGLINDYVCNSKIPFFCEQELW